MKKLISITLCVIALSTLFIGCSSGANTTGNGANITISEEPQDTASTEKKKLIAISMANTDEYRTSWLDIFHKLAGDQYDIKITNADRDFNKQIADVDSLIAMNPDVLIIQPSSDDAIVPALETAYEKGIPVILVDAIPLTEHYTALVTDDQREAGEIQADYVNAWLDENPERVANVGYLVGEYIYKPPMPRMEAFFDNCPRANKIVEQEGLFKADKAMTVTEDWLQIYPEINVYACMNDDMAIGVIQALKAAKKNLDDILVLGVDGTSAGIAYLKTGELDCTAAQDVNIAVQVCFDTIVKILNREEVEQKILPHSYRAILPEDVQ
jgi:ABC-type sugar transport system substrate-binding protein